jgi:hypothetical protein
MICWILLCVFMYLIFHQFWDILIIIIIIIIKQNWKRHQCLAILFQIRLLKPGKNARACRSCIQKICVRYQSELHNLIDQSSSFLFFSMMHIMVSLAPRASKFYHHKNRLAYIFSIIQWITEFKIYRSPFGW